MSNVRFEEFAREFANDLEIDGEQYLTAKLKDIPQYDSMGKIIVSLTIERLFGFQIAYEFLDQSETLQSLYEVCCKQGKGS
jgi:acyl carrier protein